MLPTFQRKTIYAELICVLKIHELEKEILEIELKKLERL